MEYPIKVLILDTVMDRGGAGSLPINDLAHNTA